MLRQVHNLVSAYRSKNIQPPASGPIIFLIAAASGTGKRTLMHAMWTFGKRSIQVIRKATTRRMHKDDGPEIYRVSETALGGMDIRYEFHHTSYGIDTQPIWEGIAAGRPQILITNMQQFDRFRSEFGDIVVCLYLHATRTRAELFKSQLHRHRSSAKATAKVHEIAQIHEGYIQNISSFRHVLLNTIQREDFWEQMFRLILYYKGERIGA